MKRLIASDLHGSAHCGLPERDIKHMVQAEGDQGTLHEAVKPCSRIPGAEHEAADS